MENEILKLTDRLFESINSHDLEKFAQFYAPEYEGIDVGQAAPHYGPEGARQCFQGYLLAFPDLKLSCESVTEGNRVAISWTGSGTHRGALMRIPPTGRKIEVRGTTFLEVENGKVRKGLSVWDVAGLLRTMGLLPELA